MGLQQIAFNTSADVKRLGQRLPASLEVLGLRFCALQQAAAGAHPTWRVQGLRGLVAG
jgi:hypothetical protein